MASKKTIKVKGEQGKASWTGSPMHAAYKGGHLFVSDKQGDFSASGYNKPATVKEQAKKSNTSKKLEEAFKKNKK